MGSWSCPAWRMWQLRQLAGSVGEAVQAGEAVMVELAAIAPEKFMDPTATAPSRGRGAGVSELMEVSQDTAESTNEG
eukprot:1158020-Pelagomonas_calceolata.AAC.4